MAKKVKLVVPGMEEVAEKIGIPLRSWASQCHLISIAIVNSGILGVPCRVARGVVSGYHGQHSWIVVGMDCYDPKATIVDPTLWTMAGRRNLVEGIFVGLAKVHDHRPHGMGSIWDWGRPGHPVGPVIPPPEGLSRAAKDFLAMAGPGGLDFEGWRVLAHAPVQGWPAGEIIAAMAAMPEVVAHIPLDRIGMLTELNPGGLYLARDPALKS